jgi:hypothetical protein
MRTVARRTRLTLTLTGVGLACALTAATTVASAAPQVAPGRFGSPLTLQNNADFSGYDVATVASGTAYIGWIGTPNGAGVAGRDLHLCTLRPGGTQCVGGVQTSTATENTDANDLHVVVSNGVVVLLYAYQDGSQEDVDVVTSSAGGPLSSPQQFETLPELSQLTDAVVAPGGKLWTLTELANGSQVTVHEGADSTGTTLHTPWTAGTSALDFSGSTPVVVVEKYGAITTPGVWASAPSGTWSGFHTLAKTWTTGTQPGLVETSHGLRLVTTTDNSSYRPVLEKWTGSGFSSPSLTAQNNKCDPLTHDTVTDPSGRIADVSEECSNLDVADYSDATHVKVTQFASGGTFADGVPQIGSTSRALAYVAWTIESGSSDKLQVQQVQMGNATRTITHHHKYGAISVRGPYSCLGDDSTPVGVSGKGHHGWHVAGTSLTLDGKTVSGKSLNGASLTSSAEHVLKGVARFSKRHHRDHTTHATLTFRACPTD